MHLYTHTGCIYIDRYPVCVPGVLLSSMRNMPFSAPSNPMRKVLSSPRYGWTLKPVAK